MLHSVANPQLIFVSIFTYLITEEGDGLNEWKNFKNELTNRLGYDEASSSSSNTDGGLSVPKQGLLNPFSTTGGLSTLLAGFAYRKNGFAHPKRALWTPARGAIYAEIGVLGILIRQYHH